MPPAQQRIIPLGWPASVSRLCSRDSLPLPLCPVLLSVPCRMPVFVRYVSGEICTPILASKASPVNGVQPALSVSSSSNAGGTVRRRSGRGGPLRPDMLWACNTGEGPARNPTRPARATPHAARIRSPTRRAPTAPKRPARATPHAPRHPRAPRVQPRTRPAPAAPRAACRNPARPAPATPTRPAPATPHAARTYHAPCQLAFFAFWCMMVLRCCPAAPPPSGGAP